jgi:hypothetical protein
VRVYFSAISVLLYAMGRELKGVPVELNIGILASSIDYNSGKGLVTCEDGSTYCTPSPESLSDKTSLTILFILAKTAAACSAMSFPKSWPLKIRIFDSWSKLWCF